MSPISLSLKQKNTQAADANQPAGRFDLLDCFFLNNMTPKGKLKHLDDCPPPSECEPRINFIWFFSREIEKKSVSRAFFSQGYRWRCMTYGMTISKKRDKKAAPITFHCLRRFFCVQKMQHRHHKLPPSFLPEYQNPRNILPPTKRGRTADLLSICTKSLMSWGGGTSRDGSNGHIKPCLDKSSSRFFDENAASWDAIELKGCVTRKRETSEITKQSITAF